MSESMDLQQLLDAALGGDEQALGGLLEHFRPQLRKTIHANLQSPLQRRIDASDIVHEAFIGALGAFPAQFSGTTVDEFWAWLFRIQRNALIDAVRKHEAKRRDARQDKSAGDADQFPGQITSPSQKAMRGESHSKLEAAINQLPKSQREAVRLRHLEGREIATIAEILGKSPPATAQLIYRGISALKKLLEEG